MTRELLNKVARENKINLSHYDHVFAFINVAYTKLYIEFSSLEVCGGNRMFVGKTMVAKSVAAINRRNATRGEAGAWEYTTQGYERIESIK